MVDNFQAQYIKDKKNTSEVHHMLWAIQNSSDIDVSE